MDIGYYDFVRNDNVIIDIYRDIARLEVGALSTHGLPHIKHVVKNVERLCDALSIHKERAEEIKVAAMLHDVGYVIGITDGTNFKKNDHAIRSAKFARTYLEEMGVAKRSVDPIVIAIENHSEGEEHGTDYGRILTFADKVDIIKTRHFELGKTIPGFKEYYHINEMNFTIDDNVLVLNYGVTREINLEALKEYYFTKKLYRATSNLATHFGLDYVINFTAK